jgi:hypothetical protein
MAKGYLSVIGRSNLEMSANPVQQACFSLRISLILSVLSFEIDLISSIYQLAPGVSFKAIVVCQILKCFKI